MPEPNDDHSYAGIYLTTRNVRLIRKAFARYKQLLDEDSAALSHEPDLVDLVGDTNTLPVAQEAARIERIVAWLDEKITAHGSNPGFLSVALSHGYLRLTKSVCSMYLRHLRSRRNLLAQRPGVSTHLLSSVDGALLPIEELMRTGVFEPASEVPLLVNEVPMPEMLQLPDSATSPIRSAQPPPTLIASIEILDSELRSRCLDLYKNFSDDGQQERLDTVVAEATRILEARIRRVSNAPDTLVGVELAAFAFKGSAPVIHVSSNPAEQEAAHLLFRGVFGFIRNPVHHHLNGQLQPQRVVQILGMIDYLLSLVRLADD